MAATKKRKKTGLTVDAFDGDLASAQARLRAAVEEVCGVLTAVQLNFLSGCVNAQLDNGFGERCLRMLAELAAERSDFGVWWREFARKNADIHGSEKAGRV
ncbi:MAG TPA: hypothetical protein VNV82_11880 [Bryobacteraceae bacterium]|jgi:hypothetical protein|nr:hypothetical protein [Bryobacteraceae bacterium]